MMLHSLAQLSTSARTEEVLLSGYSAWSCELSSAVLIVCLSVLDINKPVRTKLHQRI
jgi:hypothetical protein